MNCLVRPSGRPSVRVSHRCFCDDSYAPGGTCVTIFVVWRFCVTWLCETIPEAVYVTMYCSDFSVTVQFLRILSNCVQVFCPFTIGLVTPYAVKRILLELISIVIAHACSLSCSRWCVGIDWRVVTELPDVNSRLDSGGPEWSRTLIVKTPYCDNDVSKWVVA